MKIGIIGCGNMGRALINGLIAQRFTGKRNIFCSDRDKKKLKSVRLKFGVSALGTNSALIKKSNVIILALKPQDVGRVCRDAVSSLRGKTVISICAGITTKTLEGYLGKVSLVRVMPNMPAQICQGISVMTPGKYATLKDRNEAKAIFSCVGEVVEVKEKLMDAVTAIGGSGPAYFFYLVENLIYTAKKLGISQSLAETLAIKTALGSAMLMDASGKSPQVLRKCVTSKGGTTAAAFKVLKKRAFGNILQQACYAAAKRSKQLQK